MSKISILGAVSLFMATTVFGQNFPADYEKVLLPIAIIHPVPGAFGSQWATRLSVTNTSEREIAIPSYHYIEGGCPITCAPNPPTPAGVTFYPLLPVFTTEVQGFFFYVERGRLADVDLHLRIQDVSRQSRTWGTEIPVVKETEARTGRVNLTDIPLSPEFRSTLRIYDFDPDESHAVRMRFFAVDAALTTPVNPVRPPDRLLHERTDTFRTAKMGGGRFSHPGYIELNLTNVPEIASAGRLRIEIEPVTAGLRYWAMISITNNDTQHVTLVTPQ